MTFLYLKPSVWVNSLNSLPLNGGLLSDRTISGIPNVENVLSNFEITVNVDVERTILITG